MNVPKSYITSVPKHSFAPTPEIYHVLVANGMEKLAIATLAQIPSIQDGAVIHDTGCGTGAAILDSSIQISIKATDINDHALEIYNKQAADQSWPAETIHIDSTALSFPNGTFAHSIGNVFLFVLSNDSIDAVRETYRTLRPEGIPTAGTPPLSQGTDRWGQAEFLLDAVDNGGFEKDKIALMKADVYVTNSEFARYAAMLWSLIGGTLAVWWLPSDK